MIKAPELESERLFLQGHQVSEFQGLARLWADEKIVKFITGKPLSVEDAWARLLRYAGHWPLMGYGYWAVHRKDTGSYVGDVGFLNNEHARRGQAIRAPEAGWAIASEYHGRGYGREAVGTVLAWADQEMHWDETACVIDPGNLRSIALAERLGFTHLAGMTGLSVNSKVMFRQRSSNFSKTPQGGGAKDVSV